MTTTAHPKDASPAPSRHRVLHIPRSVGIVLIGILLAAVLGPSLPGVTAWQRVLQNAAHGPVFAAIAVVLALMQTVPVAARSRPSRIYWSAFVGAVVLGVATELAQILMQGRDASMLDVLHDAVGASLGLALLAMIEARRLRPVALAVVLLAFTNLTWEPFECARAYAARNAAFPGLAAADSAADLYFLRAHGAQFVQEPLPDRWRQPGEGRALALRFAPGARPAFDIDEPAPDWRGYRILAIDITNPAGTPLSGVLRVHDARHDWSYDDRFNLPVVIPPMTRATLRVAVAAIEAAPRGRRMDLSAVANVMLFTTSPPSGGVFYVSRVWLE
jgi:hypothetical protein